MFSYQVSQENMRYKVMQQMDIMKPTRSRVKAVTMTFGLSDFQII
jgi:hypothetical protein